MRQEAGWGTAAILIAAVIGFSSLGGKPSAEPGSAKESGSSLASNSASAVKSAFAKGPCVELESRLKHFFLQEGTGITAPRSCYVEGNMKGGAGSIERDATDVRIIIASLPDPLHTHLPLLFDRATEAIQQAAQDEGYLYDSSWLPWDTQETSYALLRDKEEAEDRTLGQEDQPGLLLFRHIPSSEATDFKQPFHDGLVVFIVGEEPTGGIHRRQFGNAVAWATALQPKSTNQFQIVGPTFSGSFPSLVELLHDNEIHGSINNHSPSHLEIISGNVTSEQGAKWFVDKAHKTLGDLHIRFHSTQESDEAAMDSYCQYLDQAKYDLGRLAIISEDETAFGGEYLGKDNVSLCRPTQTANSPLYDGRPAGPAYFYYPRDISALRAAYQSQSIFTQANKESANEPVKHTLQSDLADPQGEDHDTIRDYNTIQTALSQEAELQQIAAMLRAHDSQYILLRSSNPVDQIFLSHYFKLVYPRGRIVTVGADLLFRRETGASGLNGTMTLSTYPLLPWEYDWTKPRDPKSFHGHRVFSQDGAEGTYAAVRFLLHRTTGSISAQEEDSHDLSKWSQEEISPRHTEPRLFLPANCDPNFDLRDYDIPFWLHRPQEEGCRQPNTWLSVLGNGGFWPVATLDSVDADGRISESEADDIDKQRWAPMPTSMKLLLIAALFGAVFHALCCVRPSVTVKPSHRAHFVKQPSRSHATMILIGSVLVALVPITMAWGCGAMSQRGMPLSHSRLYGLAFFCIWLLAGSSVVANEWVEFRLQEPCDDVVDHREDVAHATLAFIKVIGPPIMVFTLISFAFYVLVDLVLEPALHPTDRMLTYWRAMNLTSGVSPLVPLLALNVGLYIWFWYSVQGIALLGEDRPVLPSQEQLGIQRKDGRRDFLLRMLSQEDAARPLERLADPLSGRVWGLVCFIFVVIGVAGYFIAGGFPIRNLCSSVYSQLFCVWLALSISVLIANTWQLLHIWLKLRTMLVFLDKLPLRRTLDALKGFSWGSIWNMGGNVLDTRYKLVFRQLESVTHLRASLLEGGKDTIEASYSAAYWIEAIDKTRGSRVEFARWYSEHWDSWRARDLTKLRRVQYRLAQMAAMLLTELLIPKWREESHSLILAVDPDYDDKEGKGKSNPVTLPALSMDRRTQNAEELVCLVYMGFIQNILGRMRSIVMGIVGIFISVTVSVSSYPFDPRPLLSGLVVMLFLVTGTIIVSVYAQLYRDATLSKLTNTTPGELGGDFWVKLISFGVGPVVGLIASVFPEFSDFLFSWIQPGMASIK